MGLVLLVVGACFSALAEVKSLKFQNNGSDDIVFYSDSNEEYYWTKDKILEVHSKPFIYWEEFDYTLGVTWECDFSEWPERLIEIVVPILKKYKYVLFIGCDIYDIEYFLIEENKVYGRCWLPELKDKNNKKKKK